MNSALIIVILIFISFFSVAISAGVVMLVLSIQRKRHKLSEQKEQAPDKAEITNPDSEADVKEE